MKPLRLSMTAFGPFGGTEEIDFRNLDESRLFLIHGETGAGKSTILDGICTALYGETAGGERSPEEMRSDHAPADLQTELELDFSVGDEVYRVHRIPRQERAKKKGKGMTSVNAAATLWRLSGPERDATTTDVLAERKVTLVGEKIVGILGLEANQFRQVVVLPQGKFRRLLTADSKQREEILEKLFDTEIYRRVEQGLADRASALRSGLQEARDRRQGMLQSEGVETREGLEAKIAGMARALTFLVAEAKQSAVQADTARSAHVEAKQLAQRFEALDGAQQALEKLVAQEGTIEAERRRLAEAEKAAKIGPRFDAMRSAVEAAGKRRASDETAHRVLADALEVLEVAKKRAEEARESHSKNDARRQELTTTTTRVELVRAWTRRVASRKEAESRLTAAKKQLKLADETLKAHEANAEEVAERLAKLASADAESVKAERRLDEAKQKLEAIEGLLASVKHAERCAATSQKSAKARDAAAKLLAEKVEAALALSRAVESGSAALLARTLEGGAPCPVCGATEHPKPAEASEALPSEEAREAADAQREKAQTSFTEAEGKLGEARATEAVAREAAEKLRAKLGDEDLEAAKLRLDEAKRAHEAAQARSKERVTLSARSESLVQDRAPLAKRHEDARSDVTSAEAGAKSARDEEDAAEMSLGEGERALEVLEKRSVELAAAVSNAEKEHERAQTALTNSKATEAGAQKEARGAATERRRAMEELAAREAEWKSALDESPFEDAEAFEAAHLGEEDREALGERLVHHAKERAVADATMKDHHDALGERSRPDVERARALADEAKAQADESKARVAREQGRLEHSRALALQIAEEAKANEAVEEQYERIGHLSNLASGNKGKKLSLQRFVLGSFLDDVLRQASLHLRETSRGRYDLRRRDDVTDKRKQHGLDLDVFDYYTGEQRPATTLSGGEGFLAALALALGLADVVQAHAGGIRLETVFVDEGFGSLDPETLDLAVGTLLQLQESGRLVGVISHVGELKERIDVRLEVTKTDQGSEARFRLPG